MSHHLPFVIKIRIVAFTFVASLISCGDNAASSDATNNPHPQDIKVGGDVVATDTNIDGTTDQTTLSGDSANTVDSTADMGSTGDTTSVQHPVLKPFPDVPQCAPACESPGDCTKEAAGPGAFGPEEWGCINGGCVYTGCGSDESCKESLGKNLSIICNTKISPPSCDFLCEGNDNCGFSSDPDGGALGDDNYVCEEQTCHYNGCKSDEECSISYLSFPQNYHCQPFEGAPPRCVPTCTTAEDCYLADPPGGAYGLDNWECQQGACRWLGCFSDEECDISTPGTSKRVCLSPQ